MRNLVVVRDASGEIDLAPLPSGGGERVVASCVDPENSIMYAATDACNVYGMSAGDGWKMVMEFSLVMGSPQILPEPQHIVGMQYVLEMEALFIAVATGEVIMLTVSTQEAEVVGDVPGGIACMEWSPGGEAFLLVSGGGMLMLMNKDCCVLGDGQLPHPQGAGAVEEPSYASVRASWRGDGKYVAVAAQAAGGAGPLVTVWEQEGCEFHSSAEAVAGEGALLPGGVAWMPRGALIAAPQEAGGSGGQRVAFYERNGLRRGEFDLPSGSPPVAALSFNASSEVLAVTLAPPGGGAASTVQLWHRSNYHWYLKLQLGLGAGGRAAWDEEKPLRLYLHEAAGGMRALDLAWDCHVSAGATAAVVDGARVLLTPFAAGTIPPPMCAVAVACRAPVLSLGMGPAGGTREVLVALLADGSLALAESSEGGDWEVAAEGSEEEEDDDDEEYDGQAHLTMVARTVALRLGEAGGRDLRDLQVAAPGVLLALAAALPGGFRGAGGEEAVVEIHVEGDGGSEEACTPLPAPAVRLAAAPEGLGGAVLHLADNSVWVYQAGGRLTPAAGIAATAPSPCPWLRVAPGAGPPATRAVGLTASGHLTLGGASVDAEVTTFALHSEDAASEGATCRLLYVTRSDVLHIVTLGAGGGFHRSQAVAGEAASGEEAVSFGKRGGEDHNAMKLAMHAAMRPTGAHAGSGGDGATRAVESGARLVAAVPGDVAVVLQMPRGNLEVVYPRALTLAAATAAIRRGDWSEAMSSVLRHRVDTNLIVDYGWPHFLRHVDEFVSQVARDDVIADLLGTLWEGSVTGPGGLYSHLLPWAPGGGGEEGAAAGQVGGGGDPGKIARVCGAVRGALERAGCGKYFKTILATHARSRPEELEAALELVRGLREAALAEEEGEGGRVPPAPEGAPSAEEAMKHLVFLSDADRLYERALGMYDLPLAYMVAAHSHKDPGEFVASLERLQRLPEMERRYTIDLQLERWDQALMHMLEAGEAALPRAEALLKQHPALFPVAIAACEVGAEARPRLMRLYAGHLATAGRNEDAAVVLVAAGDLRGALDAYRAAGQWLSVFALAGRLKMPAAEVRKLARDMVEELQGLAMVADAGRVAIEFGGDLEGGVALLLQAAAWREAMLACYSRARGDLVETDVAPAAAAAAKSVLEDLQDNSERVGKYLARLLTLQQKRMQMASVIADLDEDGPQRDWDDLESEASMVSGFSAYTDATHTSMASSAMTGSSHVSTVGGRKGKKKWGSKKDRKGKRRIRAGSVGEEAALMTHLEGLAVSRFAKEQAGQLCELLVHLGHEGDARTIQQALGAFIDKHAAAVAEAGVNRMPAEEERKGQMANQQGSGGGGGGGGGAPAEKEVEWKWALLRAPPGGTVRKAEKLGRIHIQ